MNSLASNAPSLPTWLLYAKAVSRFHNADPGLVLPDIRLVQPGFRLSQDHLARYRQLCGFRHANEIPVTYIFVMTLRMQLALAADDRFPFRTAGLVHTACAMELFQDIDPMSPLDLSISLEAGAPVASGREIIFRIGAEQRGRLAAECSAAFRVRGPKRRSPGPKAKASAPIGGEPLHTVDFPSNIGWDYARLSGDYNPIHLSRFLARRLGFRAPIVHGMYSAARVLALARDHGARPITAMDVSFKRPLPLPSAGLLRFSEPGNGAVAFEMTREGDTAAALSGRCINT